METKTTRRWLRRLLKVVLGCLALLVLVMAWWLGPALYHRWWLFPRQVAAFRTFADQRQTLPPPEGWQELVGACHVHSFLSHDSTGRFEDILAAAQKARLGFVLMADHTDSGRADYARQWTGLHAGVRFVPGFEMKHGFMPWGLPADTVLNAADDPPQLARHIRERGGLLFFAHSEEERLWDLPELTGMEIYNIHGDLKGMGSHRVLAELLLNARRYPDQVLRLIFDRPTGLLQRWDGVSRGRRIVGIAANDAHQNSGLQGFLTASNTFQLATTGPDDLLWECRLNGLTRPLVRLLCGSLQTNGPLFRLEADRYETMLRFVNTHIWVRNNSEAALLDSLRQGRVLVAFSHLADARGFQFRASWPGESAAARAMVGDEVPFRPGVLMEVQSPLPCRLTLMRDGQLVTSTAGATWQVAPTQPGKYRVEAELSLRGEWVPWVYTNPITFTGEVRSFP